MAIPPQGSKLCGLREFALGLSVQVFSNILPFGTAETPERGG